MINIYIYIINDILWDFFLWFSIAKTHSVSPCWMMPATWCAQPHGAIGSSSLKMPTPKNPGNRDIPRLCFVWPFFRWFRHVSNTSNGKGWGIWWISWRYCPIMARLTQDNPSITGWQGCHIIPIFESLALKAVIGWKPVLKAYYTMFSSSFKHLFYLSKKGCSHRGLPRWNYQRRSADESKNK